MLSKEHIEKTLADLDKRYEKAILQPGPESVYFSKLALLEYCSWIEESFDAIVYRSVKGKLKTKKFQELLEKNIVGRTYGFQYDAHFSPMLIRSIGISNVEKIEASLDKSGELSILVSELKSIKLDRGSAAHTTLKTTPLYSAPSNTIGRFNKVYPIIKKLYSLIIHL